MSRIVLLDTGPLGMVANPTPGTKAQKCQAWAGELQAKGVLLRVPAVADYEIRRELRRAARKGQVGAMESIAYLDEVVTRLGLEPMTSEVWNEAADLWGRARVEHQPTAADKALDADMMITAHARILALSGHDVEIATTNVNHLGLYANAREWEQIIE